MDAKASQKELIDKSADKLITVSHRIHANPELGFEERTASALLCDFLTDAGLKVESRYCGLETSFVARAGSGPLHLAICAEYDALPGIGHACGHNMIAAMAMGAGIAVARFADDLGITVSIVGTPAEEVANQAGKVRLLEAGGFDGVHAAMMVHPAPIDAVEPNIIAVAGFDVHYTGKEAHASAWPEAGINAADALTIAQSAIGLLRQHIRSSDRIHGIITRGGDAPNIVPAHTSAKYMVRAKTLADLDGLKEKVLRCFQAGAIATGATLAVEGGDKPDAEMHHDHEIAQIYQRNAEALGRTFMRIPGMERIAASTDMGNVSLVIPSIHPMIGINSLPASNHQPEFTAHCVKAEADKAVIDGSIAMAWTIADIATDAKLRARLIGA